MGLDLANIDKNIPFALILHLSGRKENLLLGFVLFNKKSPKQIG